MPARPGKPGPYPARGSASVLPCSPKGLTAPARTPTMPRSCWRCSGAVRWTPPGLGLPCSTFVGRPPFTGPDEQRVSWGRPCGEAWAPTGQSGVKGKSPLGFTEAPPPRSPEAAADLPVHRHLLPEQHLRVSLLLLPPGLSPGLDRPHRPASWPALSPVLWRATAGGANKPLHLAMMVYSVASGHGTGTGRERGRRWPGGGWTPLSGSRLCGSRISKGNAGWVG